jgi:hypothetical protein
LQLQRQKSSAKSLFRSSAQTDYRSSYVVHILSDSPSSDNPLSALLLSPQGLPTNRDALRQTRQKLFLCALLRRHFRILAVI